MTFVREKKKSLLQLELRRLEEKKYLPMFVTYELHQCIMYFNIIHGPFSRFENTGLTWTRMENLMSQSLQQ